MQMNQQNTSNSIFTVAYEGSALLDNTIRARDLAPALLAMDNLLQSSNGLLNPQNVFATLNVRAHRPGSFEIEFVLAVIPMVVNMMGSDVITSAANMVRLLFGSQHPGLFTIGKFLRGRLPSSTETSGDSIIIESEFIRGGEESRQRLVVPQAAFHLFEDPRVRRAAFDTLSPLRQEGIDVVVVKEGDNELERVTEDDVASFISPSREGVIGQSVTRQFLVIDTSRLSKRSRQWRFFDGNRINSYTMMDEDFIDSIMRREVGFLAGDIFECEVRSIQRIDSKGGIKTDFEITKVFGRRTPPSEGTQTTLDF